MNKKLILAIIGIAVVVVMTAAAGTFAFLSDTETSTGNGATAWTSALWTQTSQADFNSGVLNNVDTSSSPGNVGIPSSALFYPASNTSGNWAIGSNAYASDNGYATYNPNIVLTKSPASNTGAAWTNPNYAYASDSSYATITSGAPSGNNIWGGYGLTLTGDVITQVRAGVSAFSAQPTVTFRATSTANGSTTVSLAQPALTVANDVLIAFIIDQSTTNAQSTAPTGWQGRGFTWVSGRRFQVFSAVVGQNSLTASPWTFNGLTDKSLGVIIAYYNADTTGYGGFDTTVSARSNASGIYGTSGITTVTNNSMIIAAFGTAGNADPGWLTESCVTIGGLTQRIDRYANNDSIAIADKIAAAGPTGDSNATVNNDKANSGILLALKPAGVQARLDVSWGAGAAGTWSTQQTINLSSTKTTYYFDVTSAVAWDATKLNDTNFKVRVDTNSASGSVVSLDWLPVEVTYYNTTLWNQNYNNYNIALTGDLISKVEVGFEAFAASSEKIQIQVSWNNGVNWSALQTSAALGSSDPNSTTWFNFTPAASWTPVTLNNTNFLVSIWYLNNGALGQVSLDYLPVRVTYLNPSGTLASQVFNTTLSGTRWDGIVWDSTVPVNTTLTFEVRASDTSFLPSASTPSWASVGSSPVLAGLPSGRYMQWRATFTTTIVTALPILSEVRTYYYHG